ncbi:MAG: glutamine synthetase beta-grasp domain-containing protein, partial [Candidatus Bilamarchaeaceae archaeon]
MMPTPEDVFEFISSTNSRWVDLQFFDVEGRLQRTTVNAREFDQSAFSKGVCCGDLKEVFGWSEEGELILLPDANTYGKVPWEPSTIRLICGILVSPKAERFLKDPRYVAERAALNAKAMGFTNVTVGTSFEFYVLDNVTVDKMTPQRGPNTLIESREAPWTPSPLWSTG